VRRTQTALSYADVRAHTEALAAPLSPEDQTVQSMPDVSPTKWHRAHTTWFFETFVLSSQPGYRPFDERFAFLFNSYYEGVGPRHERSERGLLTRPGVAEVADYRAHVDAAMAGVDLESELVQLGLHHEQQHQELLLMDIKHVLSVNPYRPAYADGWHPAVTTSGSVVHEGGLVDVGHDGTGFAFDNEGPRHRVWLEPFALELAPVTCGDWLEFMADDGYHRPELWLSDGWATIRAGGWEAPMYWEPSDGWHVYTLEGLRPVDHGEPVCHVSYYEADAFARWAGARLPTEQEWEAAADVDPALVAGDVWTWTSSAYSAYPGFTPAPGAVGVYYGKFMVKQFVLRGGPTATSSRRRPAGP
jgi:ergothioneine biosynthesis protein EgtB